MAGTRRLIGTAALTAAGLVATVGGISYAAADHGSTATPGPTSASSAARAAHHRAGLLGHAEYGQLVVRRKGQDVTLDVQHGTLTTVALTGADTGTITVRSVDGHTQSYVLLAASRVRTRGAVVSLSTLHAGERVGVLARVSGSTASVTRMSVRPAAATPATSPSAAPSGA